MSFTKSDYQYMARALKLARHGLYTTDPNPRVGCVIVSNGEIVGEGWHEKAGEPHAEIHALNNAASQAQGATVYLTLEPCCHQGKTPPCTDALIDAEVARVIVAMSDPNPQVAGNGLKQLQDAGIQVELGLLENEAHQLNPGFIQRMKTMRPFVRSKMAMSLDGRTAMASGESKWITSEASRQDVQHWRARSSAIVTGVGTVLADDPAMTVRNQIKHEQPLRVVIDTNLSMPESARMLKEPGNTLIVTCSEDEDVVELLTKAGAEVITVPMQHSAVDLHAMLTVLAEREINEVLLETGATLSGAMLTAGLIDELIIYIAPVLMGDNARGLFRLPLLQAMHDKIQLEIQDIRSVGVDWRVTARVAQAN